MKFSTPYFKNGFWISKNEDNHVKFIVEDDECRTKINEREVQFTAEKAELIFAKSFEHAMRSIYLSDILENGGIIPSSIVFTDNQGVFVWFSMSKSSRMIAVKIIDGQIDDIYCEHP